MLKHGFCSIHRVAYNRDLDATCPQCLLAHMAPPKQYDFDEIQQKPLDDSGKPFDARGAVPVK
jgi:hypothetical protein